MQSDGKQSSAEHKKVNVLNNHVEHKKVNILNNNAKHKQVNLLLCSRE